MTLPRPANLHQWGKDVGRVTTAPPGEAVPVTVTVTWDHGHREEVEGNAEAWTPAAVFVRFAAADHFTRLCWFDAEHVRRG